ncbi:MAG: hypothetical protein JWO44_955 [Bacteroidetes bacterium]|nr:hypothetical protein [Bacteroidota bacterium]
MVKRMFQVIVVSVLLSGCLVSHSITYYLVDNGKHWKKEEKATRYFGIQEKAFYLSVELEDSCVIIGRFLHTKASEKLVVDDVSKIEFIEFIPTLHDTKTGSNTVLSKNPTTHNYDCQNFHSIAEKSDAMNLVVVYNQDSLGIITSHRNEYRLIKKKYHNVYFAVH